MSGRPTNSSFDGNWATQDKPGKLQSDRKITLLFVGSHEAAEGSNNYPSPKENRKGFEKLQTHIMAGATRDIFLL